MAKGLMEPANPPLTIRSAKSAQLWRWIGADHRYSRLVDAVRRMQWHQERRRVLAENVAKANLPDLRPRASGAAEFSRHRSGPPHPHITADNADTGAAAADNLHYEVRPGDEDEKKKVASNAPDFDAVADLYSGESAS